VESTVAALFARALVTAMLLALPVVGGVAVLGAVVGIVQTVVQVQDQNISFFPKLVAVAMIAAVAGLPALALLTALLTDCVAALPRLAGG